MIFENTYPLIDIGANLTNKVFSKDLELVIERAQQTGIGQMVVTGTNLYSSEQALLLTQRYPDVLCSTAGIHPHDAKEYTNEAGERIKSLAKEHSVKAIGETGLDFNRNFSTPEQQVRSFEKHIELAISMQLPLFLHERDAHSTQWEILKSYRDSVTAGVIHCFTGTKAQAFKYLDLNLSIGLTGWICDERRGYHLHEFISDIPLQQLMVETDAPYLVPRVKPKPPLPSKSRNEPCTLPYIIEEIAKHRPESYQDIAQATTRNAKHFFGLD